MATSSIMLTLVFGIVTCNLCAARRVKTLGSRRNELSQERKEDLSMSKGLQKDPSELADLIQKFEMNHVVLEYSDRGRVEEILAEREGGVFAEIIQRAPGLSPETTAFDKEGVEISKEEFETLDKSRFPLVLKSKLQEAQRLESEEKEKEEERSVSKGSLLEYSIRNENNLTGIDPVTLATVIKLGDDAITAAQAYESHNIAEGNAMRISVVPKDAKNWTKMTGWLRQTMRKFDVIHYVTGQGFWSAGTTQIHVWCTPDFHYWGRYGGTGRYLQNVQMRCAVSSMFGWSADQKVLVGEAVNMGSLSNPTAELPLTLETRIYSLGVERVVKKVRLIFRANGGWEREDF